MTFDFFFFFPIFYQLLEDSSPPLPHTNFFALRNSPFSYLSGTEMCIQLFLSHYKAIHSIVINSLQLWKLQQFQ